MLSPIRCLFHVLASVAVLRLALVFVEATAASAGATWSGPSEIDGSNYLTSVSCPSTRPRITLQRPVPLLS